MESETIDTTNYPRSARQTWDQSGHNLSDTERWISLIGGGLLAAYALPRRGWGGVLPAIIGLGLIQRGASGYCHLYKALGINTTQGQSGQTIQVSQAITINRSPEELFRFWRNFENLPRFMSHLEKVTVEDPKRSHWVAKGPVGTNIEWDAEILLEKPNELISWRSTSGDVANAGSVRFLAAPGGRGCEVHVRLAYKPPAGALGASIAKLLGEEPQQQVRSDLRQLKYLLETGEVPVNQNS